MNKTQTPGSQGSQEIEALCCISVDVVGSLSVLEYLHLDLRSDPWNDDIQNIFEFFTTILRSWWLILTVFRMQSPAGLEVMAGRTRQATYLEVRLAFSMKDVATHSHSRALCWNCGGPETSQDV